MRGMPQRGWCLWLLALVAAVGIFAGLAQVASAPVFLAGGHDHPLNGSDFGENDADTEETLETEEPKDPYFAAVRGGPPPWVWVNARRLDDESLLMRDRLAISKRHRPPIAA